MDLVDILPDVRYWSVVLCCTILTHISDLEVKVTDFEILCLSFLVKVFRSLYLLKLSLDLVDTLPDMTLHHSHSLIILAVKVTDFEILC